MEQRRLPDLHGIGDVAGRGPEVTTLREQRRRRKQDAAPRRRPVDGRGSPTLPVLHRSILSPNRCATGEPWPKGVTRSLALLENRSVPILVAGTGDIAHHVLDGEVLLERVVAHVLAESGCPEAAVRHLADDRDVVVDPDTAGLDLARRALCAIHVARPGRRRKAVLGVVGLP